MFTTARLCATIVVLSVLCTFSTGGHAAEISDGVVKIGLILDLTGPYSAIPARAAPRPRRMAVEDFGGNVLGAPIEFLVADHTTAPTAPPRSRATGSRASVSMRSSMSAVRRRRSSCSGSATTATKSCR